MFDIIVVGAGPVGLYVTKLLENNLKILLLEKTSDTSNKACSGLISTNIEKFLKVDNTMIEHEINGAVIHSAFGSKIKLEKEKTVAYVIDRKKLNQKIMKNMKTKPKFKTEIKDLKIKKDCVEVSTNRGLFKSKMIVAADGANSFVRNYFGEKPKLILKGLIAITSEKNSSKFVEVFVDKKKIKDGFFWKIPRGKKTEYGAFGTDLNFKKLEKFFGLKKYTAVHDAGFINMTEGTPTLNRPQAALKNQENQYINKTDLRWQQTSNLNQRIERRAGLIPLGLIKTNFERAILIGDAACQVKPWSGGGIIYGFKAAQIVQKVILSCFEKDNFSEKALQQYDLQWKKQLGRYIRMGLILRSFYKKMNNKVIEIFFKKTGKIKFLNELDMDFPRFPGI